MDLRFHRHIDPPTGFESLVSFDVAPSGNAITTWATAEVLARLTTRTGGSDAATFPTTRPERPVDVAVVEHDSRIDQVPFSEVSPPRSYQRSVYPTASSSWVHDADGQPTERNTTRSCSTSMGN